MTNRYSEQVQTAAQALSQGEEANWELARLTWENTGPGRTVTLAMWCDDIRTAAGRPFSTGTAGLFRRVWDRRLTLEREGRAVPSFSDLQREISPSSHDPEVVHARQAAYYLKKGTPEQKAATVATLLEDPDVVAQIERATPVARAIDRANERRQWGIKDADARYLEEHPLPVARADPLAPALDAAQALTDIEDAMEAFVLRVVAVFPRVTRMPDPASDPWARAVFMRQLVARSRGALDQIESLLNTGSPSGDIDHFMRDVLAAQKGGSG